MDESSGHFVGYDGEEALSFFVDAEVRQSQVLDESMNYHLISL